MHSFKLWIADEGKQQWSDGGDTEQLLLVDFLQRVKVKGVSAERLGSHCSLTAAEVPDLKPPHTITQIHEITNQLIREWPENLDSSSSLGYDWIPQNKPHPCCSFFFTSSC